MAEKVLRIEADVGSFNRVTRDYQGIDNNELKVLVDNIESTIEIKLKPQQYATKYEFPNIGNSAIIYIDKTENKTYRWDETNLKYYCVGSNYTQIKIINGGNASNE